MSQVVEDIFKAAGEQVPFELRPLELLCRYLYPSGRVWNVYQDLGKTTAQLSKKEAEAYRALLGEARKLFEASAPTFVYGRKPVTRSTCCVTELRHGLAAQPFKTLDELVDAYGASS